MKTYINNVELLGMVGCVNSNSDIIHFSLVTNRTYNSNNEAICETTWHLCTVPKKMLLEKKMKISKGQYLHLKGFIRNVRYEDGDGISRFRTEIVVTDLKEV